MREEDLFDLLDFAERCLKRYLPDYLEMDDVKWGSVDFGYNCFEIPIWNVSENNDYPVLCFRWAYDKDDVYKRDENVQLRSSLKEFVEETLQDYVDKENKNLKEWKNVAISDTPLFCGFFDTINIIDPETCEIAHTVVSKAEKDTYDEIVKWVDESKYNYLLYCADSSTDLFKIKVKEVFVFKKESDCDYYFRMHKNRDKKEELYYKIYK